MAHARQQIRDAIVTALTGIAGVALIEASRVRTLAPAQLPAIIVRTPSEDSERDDKDGDQQRLLTAEISVFERDGETTDDALDELCVAIETRMYADATLGGLAFDLTLTATEFRFTGEEAERSGGWAVLTFAIVYHTAKGAPETAL